MRHFALLSLLLLASLTACKSPYIGKVVNGGPHDIESVRARAERGDGDAQVQMGDYYCLNEPKADKGAQTVKWYRAGSKSMDIEAARRGAYNLGIYYLALTEYPEIWDLQRSKPKPPCTGSVRSRDNDAKAAKYLTICAADLQWPYSCTSALAIIRYGDKQYAEAYYLYALALTEFAWNREDSGQDYSGPLLQVPQPAPNQGYPAFFDDERRALFRNARLAASHLSKAEIARQDARAYTAYYKRVADGQKQVDRLTDRSRYNK